MSPKKLTMLNFIVVGYFILLTAAFYLELKADALQVVGELLTIPFLAAQYILLYLGYRSWNAHNASSLMKFSLLLLLISTILTTGSFFYE